MSDFTQLLYFVIAIETISENKTIELSNKSLLKSISETF